MNQDVNDKWRARCNELKFSPLVPAALDLEGAKQAIREAPQGFISDAALRINHNWLMGEGYLDPGPYGILYIDRRKLPYEPHFYALDIPKVEDRPPAPTPVTVKTVTSEPPPTQWNLF